MQIVELRVDSPEAIREHVASVLCTLENLQVDYFPLTERTLAREGGVCGVLFSLHGPRQLQLTAVWEIDRNVIWFYNASGQRFQKTHLQNSV